uniref:Uncharacterized protein n=1 Tax=Anguilla anguilla TaxID=7936 RepID=A0A0E9VA21_ANGAN
MCECAQDFILFFQKVILFLPKIPPYSGYTKEYWGENVC